MPDPAEAEQVALYYRLTSGPIRISPEPFVCADISAGLDRADAYLAAAWGEL